MPSLSSLSRGHSHGDQSVCQASNIAGWPAKPARGGVAEKRLGGVVQHQSVGGGMLPQPETNIGFASFQRRSGSNFPHDSTFKVTLLKTGVRAVTTVDYNEPIIRYYKSIINGPLVEIKRNLIGALSTGSGPHSTGPTPDERGRRACWLDFG